MTANKKTNQTESYPSSQHIYTIDGKRFIVTRYFKGDKDLNALITEIAVRMADRETGLLV